MIFSELDPILKDITQKAKSAGVDAEVLLEQEDILAVSFQKGAMEKFDAGLGQCAGIRVVKDGAEGYAYSESLEREALLATFEDAVANAKMAATQIKGSTGVKAKMLGNTGLPPKSSFHLPGPSRERVVAEKLEYAKQMQNAALEFDSRVAGVPYNGYREVASSRRLFTTLGVDADYSHSYLAAWNYVLAKDKDDSRMSGTVLFSRDLKEFNPQEIGRESAKKSLALLGGQQPATGLYPVILEDEVASEMMGFLASYLSGKRVVEKTSIYAGDLGKSIASDLLTLTDDPNLKEGQGYRPFDAEGVASKALSVVENGVLKAYFTNSVYAAALGTANTGHAVRGATSQLDIGPSNLLVAKGKSTRAELLAQFPKVILITSLNGFHAGFKEGSGDFSLPAEGFLYENGKMVSPVNNFVVSGNFRQMLKEIVGVGSSYSPYVGKIRSPDLLIRELSVAGGKSSSPS